MICHQISIASTLLWMNRFLTIYITATSYILLGSKSTSDYVTILSYSAARKNTINYLLSTWHLLFTWHPRWLISFGGGSNTRRFEYRRMLVRLWPTEPVWRTFLPVLKISWNGMRTGWNVQFSLLLRHNTVWSQCITIADSLYNARTTFSLYVHKGDLKPDSFHFAQRLEQKYVTFNVVRSPFVASFNPSCSRLNQLPVSLSPF